MSEVGAYTQASVRVQSPPQVRELELQKDKCLTTLVSRKSHHVPFTLQYCRGTTALQHITRSLNFARQKQNRDTKWYP